LANYGGGQSVPAAKDELHEGSIVPSSRSSLQLRRVNDRDIIVTVLVQVVVADLHDPSRPLSQLHRMTRLVESAHYFV